MSSAGLSIHFWRPSAWLEATGPDAFTFLQGQFSNDLRELDRSPAVYGLWLDRKGKCLADSFILRKSGGGLVMCSYFSPVDSIRSTLEAHLIADDVVLTDRTSEVHGVTLAGADAALRVASLGEGHVFPGRRGLPGSVEWVGFGKPAAFEGVEIDCEAMERARLEAGIPAVPVDVGPADLPNEAGLDGDAISHTKGCYLGQEVIARIRSLGQVRRRLYRVKGGGQPPSCPARLHQGAATVGELRSATSVNGGWLGLALLVVHLLKPGMGLSFAPDAPLVLELEGPVR